MRRYPEWATDVGDNRYGDKLFDASREAEAADYARARRELAEAKAIARDRLAPVDQVSLDIFVYELEQQLRMERFVGFRRLSLGSQGGFQSRLPELLRASPAATRRDAEQILARFAAYPRRVDQELAFLREGMALGWVPPRTVLERVLAQLDQQLGAGPEQSPFFEPLGRLGSDIPEADRSDLKARAVSRLAADLLPAVRRLRAFVAEEYLPRAPADGALTRLPRRRRPSTSSGCARRRRPISRPTQIHAIGLREVERLRRRDGRGASRGRLRGRLGRFPALPEWRSALLPSTWRRGARRLPRHHQARRARTAAPVRAVAARPGRRARDSRVHGHRRGGAYNGPSLDGTGRLVQRQRDAYAAPHLGHGGHRAARGGARPSPADRAGRELARPADVSPRRRGSRRTAKAGRCTPRRWARTWACTATVQPLRPPTQAWRAARLVVDTGIHASAGGGSGRSTTCSNHRPGRPTSNRRSTATSPGPARRSAT